MKKATYKVRIKQACENAGTYRPFFDQIISTLAGILERRDMAEEEFMESGAELTVEYTNKAGATNIVKNPALTELNAMNDQALAYWRELGLTPKGLKMINENAMKKQAVSFDQLLKGL